MNNPLIIDAALVRSLVTTQFPQWKDLRVSLVARQGWDNRTFHLGENLLVRLPSAVSYAQQMKKEHRWLPILAPLLPLAIPVPVVMAKPGNGYPWKWSIYRWLMGESADQAQIINKGDFAKKLAEFLSVLQNIDPKNGPQPGLHNFHRGASLSIYDRQTRKAISLLKGKIDALAATALWQSALATRWQRQPVWVHGDISLGNLLLHEGELSAVIDFGGLAVGDPACDLAIAWTFFKDESRALFRSMLDLDAQTWARGRAWALWKALIIAAELSKTNAIEGNRCWAIIDELLADYKRTA